MISLLMASYALMWTIIVVLIVAVFALYHHLGQASLTSRDGRDRQGPEKGAVLDPIERRNLRGEIVRFPVAGRPTLILFMSTHCGPCERLLPELANFIDERSDVETIVVCQGTVAEVTIWAQGFRSQPQVLPDVKSSLAARFGIGITPFCLACDEQGILRGKGLVNDGLGLRMAVDDATAAEDWISMSSRREVIT